VPRSVLVGIVFNPKAPGDDLPMWCRSLERCLGDQWAVGPGPRRAVWSTLGLSPTVPATAKAPPHRSYGETVVGRR